MVGVIERESLGCEAAGLTLLNWALEAIEKPFLKQLFNDLTFKND
jgi:hypothetical protein